ncbi:choice-of-anchor D domain-containing protein [Dyadobacter chenwenxiniae]|uniref:Choice-of-anchor D domain-containing protein n=1 Tax=Dyadobacter chenwenxiniae TaxID=2906456 RepID=A0A9X1THE7_9BACT|nr:choice-of-anchor D domain-containing protein [Dyadobacter chenwenxiniae]MCF0064705.1 choice-of-anchor D domain-containing protein [Dyadobacter chenwenxiniae]UON84241.1 choice-of-anchor D domain-containing protein [Dyadobacter chenwenxiniae]
MKQTVLASKFISKAVMRLLFATMLLFPIERALAQTTWNGSVDSDWNKPANWSAGVPDANAKVTIPDVINDPVVSEVALANSVLVESGGTLIIQAAGTLSVNGSAVYTTPFNATATIHNLGTITNNGTLTIGSAAGAGAYGIASQGTFTNSPTGVIRIDRTTDTGLYVVSGSFTNSGDVIIGSGETVGYHGIWNDGAFVNNADGGIRIDRSSLRGLVTNSNSFHTSGVITIGAIAEVGSNGVENRATLNVDACGKLLVLRGDFVNESAKNVTNAGLIQISNRLTNNGTFTNAGVLKYSDLSGSVANNYVIVNNAPTPIFSYGVGASGSVKGIYKDSDGALSAGVFSAPNHFVPDASLPVGMHALYAKVVIAAGNCEFFVPFTYVVLPPAMANQTTWTGAISGAWNEPGNWSNGVPTADYVAIIPGIFSNPPLISATTQAAAYAVHVEQAASLNIETGGSLTISGSAPYASPFNLTAALYNEGVFKNSGNLIMGTPETAGSYGLFNLEQFSNNGGTIQIDYTTQTALHNASGTFTNSGNLILGKKSSIGSVGIWNGADFFNSNTGSVSIDRSAGSAITNESGDGVLFTNNGLIAIGGEASVGTYGIDNRFNFNNNAGAEIRIDRTTEAGLHNAYNFNNAGNVTIGENADVGTNAIHNQGMITNTACATLRLLRGNFLITFPYQVENNGLLLITNSLVNGGMVTNNGVLNVGDNSYEVNVFNNSVFVQNEVLPIFRYGSSFSGTVNGIFNDKEATQPAGTFTAPNTFVPDVINNTVLTLYAKITLNSGACSYIVPFRLPAAAPAINIKGKGVIIKNGDHIADPVDDTAFGLLYPGEGTSVRTYTIENVGFAALNLTGAPAVSLTGSGDFTVTSQPAATVPPGGNTTFQITFDPSSTGNKQAIVSVASNDSYKNPYTFGIGGDGANGCPPQESNGQMVWTGAAGTDWADRCNWSPSSTPGEINDIVIPATANQPVISAGYDAKIKTLVVQGGATLTIDALGSLTVMRSKAIGDSETALYNAGTIQNKGHLTLLDAAGTATYALSNAGTFVNASCAEFSISKSLKNTSAFDNNGLMTITAASTHINTGTFTNNGIIVYPQGNSIPAVTNNEIVVVPGSVTSCETLSPAFNLNGEAAFTIAGVFRDASGLVSAGIYNAGSDTFTPEAALGEGVHGLFVKIEDVANSCVRTVPWQLTVTKCCVPPVFTAPTVTQPAYPVTTGTIVINITAAEPVEYSVDNGSNWSGNATFGNLTAGNYRLKARIAALPACESTYANNPVVLTEFTTAMDTWTGTVSDDWSLAGNWQDGTVPTTSDDVVIPDVANDPVVRAQTAGEAKSVFVQGGASLTVSAEAMLTINGFASYASLQSGAEPFNFTAGLNNLGAVNNSGTIAIGSSSGVGTYAMVNQGAMINNSGGSIQVDRSEDTGIYNAAGSFTNGAAITIGAAENIGNHGIWNDAAFTNNSGGVIKIDRSALRALMNNADSPKSVYATFHNEGAITIGENAATGAKGIENLADFNNTGAGNIHIDQTSENGLYHASGKFANSAGITIGGSAASGLNGLVTWGNFTNTASGNIQVYRVSSLGLHNASGTLQNQGKIIIGATAGAGRTGFQNNGTFNNTGAAELRVDLTLTTAIHHLEGNFNNEAQIVIGALGTVGRYGITTEAPFTNGATGTIHIDRSDALQGLGIYQNQGVFENFGDIIVGTNASGGKTSLLVDKNGTFNNNAGGLLKADHNRTLGVEVSGTLNNAGSIVVGSVELQGNYGLFNNGGVINNSLGTSGARGEIRIDGSREAAFENRGKLVNHADLFIGAISSVGKAGIDNRGSIENNTGAVIHIDQSTVNGIAVVAGTVSNSGSFVLGANNALGSDGILNKAAFSNLNGGKIQIDRSTRSALQNLASFTNAGEIIIGSTAAGEVGIETHAIFNNSTGGHIRIDNTTDIALSTPAGTFTNAAEITIGGVANVGRYGLVNRAAFTNNAGGNIRIDRSADTGLYESAGTFTNNAVITIGGSEHVGVHGIFNEAAFVNAGEGNMHIDRSTAAGLRNFNGTFTNTARVTIGSMASVGTFGIRNQAAFANNDGGSITIDRAAEGIFVEDHTFANAGTVTIGGVEAIAALLSRQGAGNFSNNEKGHFKASGQIGAAGFTNAGGTLSPGYSPGKMTFNESKDFTNSIMDIEVNGPGTAGVNYDQIEVLGTATLGGTLKLTVNYTPADGDEVIILNATAIEGQFSTVTGATRWRVEYAPGTIKLVYDSSLPVNLIEFNAVAADPVIALQWLTASETNNAGFHIERSANAANWQDIGFVKGAGTAVTTNEYRFEDNSPMPGMNYYRLRQTDFDGKTEHSRTRAVKWMTAEAEIIVWADRARHGHIKTEDQIKQVTVFDLSGRVVAVSEQKNFDLSRATVGLLLVRIQTNNRIVTKRLLLWQ